MTHNVVYALICPYNKVYVGQTSQEIRKRVQRHFSNLHLAKWDKTHVKISTTLALLFFKHH